MKAAAIAIHRFPIPRAPGEASVRVYGPFDCRVYEGRKLKMRVATAPPSLDLALGTWSTGELAAAAMDIYAATEGF